MIASGHAGPWIFQGPAKNPRPGTHWWQGSGSVFFHPAPWPVIAVSGEPFSLPPANFLFQDRVF